MGESAAAQLPLLPLGSRLVGPACLHDLVGSKAADAACSDAGAAGKPLPLLLPFAHLPLTR